MSTTVKLGRSLALAAAILGVSAVLAWIAPAYISGELARRLLGVLLGAVVVLYANVIPKMLATRARLRCPAAEDQAARRFAGWALVLGGVGYMLAWTFLPLSLAGLAGGGLLAIGLGAAIVRCLRLAAILR